jgi:hypothetical protein
VTEHASSLAALAQKFALWHPGVTTAITSMHEQRFAALNIAATNEPRLPQAIFKTLMFKPLHQIVHGPQELRGSRCHPMMRHPSVGPNSTSMNICTVCRPTRLCTCLSKF